MRVLITEKVLSSHFFVPELPPVAHCPSRGSATINILLTQTTIAVLAHLVTVESKG